VTKEHVTEIFSTYGVIKSVEFPIDRFHPPSGRGFCYIEFASADDAEAALKHMDGGQVDGQEITAAPIILPKSRFGMRGSPPMRGGGRPMNRGWRSPMRNRRRSPFRNRRNDRRSFDRRRRRSASSDSSREAN
jgi:RNA-binding protein with serine-rich domain 1